MDNKKKALEIFCIIEMGCVSVCSIKVAAIVIIVCFLYSIRYTYLYWKRHKVYRQRRSTASRKSARKKQFSYNVLVQESATKKRDADNGTISMTKDELFEKSFLQEDIPLTAIDRITGEEFETIMYNRLKSLGYVVLYTPTSHDYGADLIIETEKGAIVVQCKRYSNSIGIGAVQEVLGAMIYYHAQLALVVTNSTFTENAKTLARTSQKVVLWDRDYLKKNLGFTD